MTSLTPSFGMNMCIRLVIHLFDMYLEHYLEQQIDVLGVFYLPSIPFGVDMIVKYKSCVIWNSWTICNIIIVIPLVIKGL